MNILFFNMKYGNDKEQELKDFLSLIRNSRALLKNIANFGHPRLIKYSFNARQLILLYLTYEIS